MACLHESQALAFVAGELDTTGRGVVEDHVDDCAQCRQLLAELVRKNQTTDRRPGTDDTVAAPDKQALSTGDTHLATDRDPPPPPSEEEAKAGWSPGARVGRYVVLARIGRGGMGTVFRAEDVELGRPVALKRLHANADEDSRRRLVREAQSAAQLSHPNVVTVHEVAVHDGAPFLAMELVDGLTLTSWLREKTRSWREITNIVAQAGRGLAAAHDRGLVHRDFKPDNVLVDRTGRARVADFGLARAGGTTPDEPSGPLSIDARLARMTATGSLAGTPAYMAPELVEGRAPDPRSDQYAFAITLYEALRGQHPFAGETAARLWVEMAEGRIRSGGRAIPAWLDRHVRRGLEVDPAKRWPDVASFVAAIEKPPRQLVWFGAGLGVAALASVVGILALRAPASSGPSCDDIANEYRQTFRPEDLAYAIPDAKQLELANQAIDRFTTDYRQALRESCRATQAGTQSAAVGDKRTACLELAKRRAWFVTRGLTTGVDNRPGLATLLEELPDATACSDPSWLERASPLPVAPADREALYLAESNLIHASKVRDDGNLAQASTLLANVNEVAKRLGDRGLDARASLLASEIARDHGDMEQAAIEATEAWSAASTTGDTNLTLRAQLQMLLATASRDKRSIEGFSGLGELHESADTAKLISSYADALMASGRFKEGEEQYRRAQKMREHVLPPGHVDRVLGRQRLGAALVIQKRAKEALPILEEVAAAIDKVFPPLRREAIDGLRYLAMAEEELGDVARALELRREVFARRAQVLGADSGMGLDARADVASTLGDLGHDDEAIKELEAVVAGFLALMGEKSVNASDARVKLANRLISVGRFREADAALAIAVPMLAKSNGADSPYTMVGEYALVRSYVERPKPIKLDEATRLLDRMEPVFAKLFGSASHPVAAVTYSRARIALAKGHVPRADALITEAIAMLGDDKRSDRAEMQLFRGRVLYALGKRAEALAAAEASAKDYDLAGPGFANRAAAARAWAAKPTAAAALPEANDAHADADAARAIATAGPCAKAGDAITDVWPEERDRVESWHRGTKHDSAPVLAVIDRYVEDWKGAAQAACVAKQSQSADLAARRLLCLDRVRARATARIRAVAGGTLRAIASRRSLPDFTVCANASTLRAETLPPTEEARDRVERGERFLEEARIMLDIPYWQAASRNLTRAQDELREYDDPSLAARTQKLSDELDRVVATERAKKAAKAANSP